MVIRGTPVFLDLSRFIQIHRAVCRSNAFFFGFKCQIFPEHCLVIVGCVLILCSFYLIYWALKLIGSCKVQDLQCHENTKFDNTTEMCLKMGWFITSNRSHVGDLVWLLYSLVILITERTGSIIESHWKGI